MEDYGYQFNIVYTTVGLVIISTELEHQIKGEIISKQMLCNFYSSLVKIKPHLQILGHTYWHKAN